MEWCKLFTLLVAALSLVKTEVVKKKIRIHLPEKVKHIHHHKKIYITNHEAASQYAPAFLPSAEGAVAVPTKVALPIVASVLPPTSGELYDDAPYELPSRAPVSAASKLLPLYHARGHYGPYPGDWDDQNFDLIPTSPPTDFRVPSSVPSHSTYAKYPPKRVKVVKIAEAIPTKVTRKVKSRPSRSRIRPDYTGEEDEYQVSPFYQQFYSDLDSVRTIRKIRRPQRVEKYMDGDTEHIHTYSEEHIHKVLPPEQSIGTTSLGASHALVPMKNTQALFAFAANPYAALASVGSLGTPSHLEYAAYNPHDITYDHIFHDHGELPSNIDIAKNPSNPVKTLYNSQGSRISSGTATKHKTKHYPKYTRPSKVTPIQDFSYYENMYSTGTNVERKPILSSLSDVTNNDGNINEFRPIPAFNFNKEKPKRSKAPSSSNYGNEKLFDFGVAQVNANVPSPFSVSNTVLRPSKQYRPESTDSSSGFLSFKNPFANFKDNPTNNFEYDIYGASSNTYETKVKNDSRFEQDNQIKNINFEDDDQSVLKRVPDVGASATAPDTDNSPSALDLDSADQNTLVPTATSAPYTIKESSPAHHYYMTIPKKAIAEKTSPSELTEGTSGTGELLSDPTTVLLVVPTETPANDQVSAAPTKRAKSGPSRRRVKKINQLQQFVSNSDREIYPYHHQEATINEVKNLKYGDKI